VQLGFPYVRIVGAEAIAFAGQKRDVKRWAPPLLKKRQYGCVVGSREVHYSYSGGQPSLVMNYMSMARGCHASPRFHIRLPVAIFDGRIPYV